MENSRWYLDQLVQSEQNQKHWKRVVGRI